MKYIITTITLIFMTLTSCQFNSTSVLELNYDTSLVDSDTTVVNMDILINAMIFVESSNNDSAYCERENAVGCLQIRPIMLKECNRVLKLKKSSKRYHLNDRWNRIKSIEIFKIINKYHNRNAEYEEIARFWNGGPTWVNKINTKTYWGKVKRQFNKLLKENEEHSTDRFVQI